MTEPTLRPEAQGGPAGPSSRKAGLILSLVFPLGALFFAGWFGLAMGCAIVAAWSLLALPRWAFWALSALGLSLAPFAIWVQGLPQTPVVGADFGVRHWLATDLVIASLSLASFAGLTELLRLENKVPLLRMPLSSPKANPGRTDPAQETAADGHPDDGLLPTTKP
jgi:hypothetical protein